MIRIAVLMTCHNRKEKTIRCLNALFQNKIPQNYTIDVFLTDDGCTDGTSEIVGDKYPKVHIIEGDGNLYWNRGMYVAWKEAVKCKYDYYLWLNDDTILGLEAILSLFQIENNKKGSIIVGAVCNSHRIQTYGGRKHGKMIAPNKEWQECDTFNGNCVLIPQCVYEKIGNLDWSFRHAIGDIDYGYRARKMGFKIYTTEQYIAFCESNATLPRWCQKQYSLIKRLKNLYSPLGYAEPLPFFKFEYRNFGLLIALKHFCSIHLRVLFPQLWK